jgi:hypothetical protein
MRTLFLLGPLLITSCARPSVETQRNTPSTPADENPIVTALTHFRSLPDLWLPESVVSKSVLLVDRDYMTTKGFISNAQLDSDLSGEHWSVPEDARLDIERRTDAKERLRTTGYPSFIRVLDFQGDRVEFSRRHPDAKCSISLWPPGFTRDGSRAVVRFLFSPTSHGASAIYLLERRNGLWHVIRHKVSYYV